MSTAPTEATAPEETYLARACRLVVDHSELFRTAQVPRLVRVLPAPAPAPARRTSRKRARQLALPIAPTMRR